MKLYKFQTEGLMEISEAFKKSNSVCLAWYTGAGKTNVFSEMCRILIDADPNVRIGISAYLTTEVRDQIFDRLEKFGLKDKAQVIHYTRPINLKKNISVFNPQAVYRKMPNIKFDYLIVDESHVGLETNSLMLKKIISKLCKKSAKMLFVSATPWDFLALDKYKDMPVLKRPLDAGIADGLITDFRFHAEEAKITFTKKDFNREGDLKAASVMTNMSILKSACVGKMKYIIKTYDKDLGEKVLVICPPGNLSEIARTLSEEIGGLAFIQNNKYLSSVEHWIDTSDSLEKFKNDEKTRFLFVTNKCQVGFDMKSLSSVIDLTMTRNIKVLAQRCGRIARKNGTDQKHYFYVYDQSVMKDRLEWLIATMIDFCLGAYDGWTTRTSYYRKTNVSNSWQMRHPFTTTLSEVVNALSSKDAIENMRTLSCVTASRPRNNWTLEKAKEEAKLYANRTVMWSLRPALYKWFRLNAKDEMDRIFPIRHQLNKWNEKTVVAALKKHKGNRNAFQKLVPGAYAWCGVNKRHDLIKKYIESTIRKEWTEKEVLDAIKKCKSWQELRSRYPGIRHKYAKKNPKELKKMWRKIHGRTPGRFNDNEDDSSNTVSNSVR